MSNQALAMIAGGLPRDAEERPQIGRRTEQLMEAEVLDLIRDLGGSCTAEQLASALNGKKVSDVHANDGLKWAGSFLNRMRESQRIKFSASLVKRRYELNSALGRILQGRGALSNKIDSWPMAKEVLSREMDFEMDFAAEIEVPLFLQPPSSVAVAFRSEESSPIITSDQKWQRITSMGAPPKARAQTSEEKGAIQRELELELATREGKRPHDQMTPEETKPDDNVVDDDSNGRTEHPTPMGGVDASDAEMEGEELEAIAVVQGAPLGEGSLASAEKDALRLLLQRAGISVDKVESESCLSSFMEDLSNDDSITSSLSVACKIMDNEKWRKKLKGADTAVFCEGLWRRIQWKRSSQGLPKTFGKLLSIIVGACELAGCRVREDWFENPRNLTQRGKIDTILGEVVGLNAMPGEMRALFDCPQPLCGMLNAVPGAGKTTALRYCEQELNKVVSEDSTNPFAFGISFLHGVATDVDSKLTIEQELTMRAAGRFLVEDNCLLSFRDLWMESDALKAIQFAPLILEIFVLCGKQKLLLLVDEPGRAGSDRGPKQEAGPIKTPNVAEAVVRLAAPLLGNDTGSILGCGGDDVVREILAKVRIVFSSQSPLFSEVKLSNFARSGGSIQQIELPHTTDQATTEEVSKLVRFKCQGLRSRMPTKDSEYAILLLLALSSGHWATLDALVEMANKGVELCNGGSGWFQTIYMENLLDALVSVDKGTSFDGNIRNASMKKLLMFAILGKPVRPCDRRWEWGTPSDGTEKPKASLLDLAHERVVLNNFPVDSNSYRNVIPRLSLLDVREWCCGDDVSSKGFAKVVRGMLPSNPKESMDSGKYGKAFAGNFLKAKLHSWYKIDNKKSYLLGSLPGAGSSQPCGCLFPGHMIIAGRGMAPDILLNPPTHAPHLFQAKSFNGNMNAHTKLEIRGEIVAELRPYDQLVLPGSKIESHWDRLVVIKLQGGENGLVFIQDKFLEARSFTAQDITNALDELLAEEEGVLFDVAEGTAVSNPISQLGVQETNVVYCWSVLENLPKGTEADELLEAIQKHIEATGFQGRVMVATSNAMYGDTFGLLASVYAGAK